MNILFYSVSEEMIAMPDYQQMYLTMMRATEKALNILIEAQ